MLLLTFLDQSISMQYANNMNKVRQNISTYIAYIASTFQLEMEIYTINQLL